MRIKLLFIFLFYYTLSYTQIESSTISGKITFHHLPIENVHIYNIDTKEGTITNSNGFFEIDGQLNNVLKISHIEYRGVKITVTEEIIRNGIIINLKKVINQLPEVIIKRHQLTGSISIDSQNNKNELITKKHDLIEQMKDLAKQPSKSDGTINLESPHVNDVSPIKAGSSKIGIPIKDKENELRKKLRKQKNIPNEIIKEFGKEYFTNDLKLPEEEIYNFLTYCNYKNIFQLFSQGKTLELILILVNESKKYNQKNR